jgi:hypothetical protein
MVDNQDWVSAEETAQILNISINNLRQIQFRGNLKWAKREGRKVYYIRDQILLYSDKRNRRKNKKNEAIS